MDLQTDLPEEILFDIFLRLPAKSVGKFRCLSKSWLQFLSTQEFIKAHLARAEQESLVLLSPTFLVCTIETIEDNDGTVSAQLVNPPGNQANRFESSCDGLVLLVNNGADEGAEYDEENEDDVECEVFLVNPITREWVKIPNSPLASNENYDVDTIYGLGHDSARDDYMVVSVSVSAVSNHIFDPFDLYVDVSVYNLKTGVWRRIENPPRQYTSYDNLSGAYVNGAYHWMGIWGEGIGIDRQVINAFDLATEVFFEIPFPSGVSMEHLRFSSVGVLGGYLSVVDAVSNSVGIDVWIMEEYGVADSWKKLITIEGYHVGDVCMPLCFLEERHQVVCVVGGSSLVVYDVMDGTSRNLVVDGMPGENFDHGGSFVESLLSPVHICGAPMQL